MDASSFSWHRFIFWTLAARPLYYSQATPTQAVKPPRAENWVDMSDDSDDDYITDAGSGDDLGDHTVSRRDGTRSAVAARGAALGEKKKAAWENIERSWDAVTEGADGSINAAVQKLREQGQRKRLVLIEVLEGLETKIDEGYYETQHRCREVSSGIWSLS